MTYREILIKAICKEADSSVSAVLNKLSDSDCELLGKKIEEYQINLEGPTPLICIKELAFNDGYISYRLAATTFISSGMAGNS